MKKWMCLLLGLLAAMTLLASCGEDEEDPSSTASTPGTSSAAPVTLSPSPSPAQTAKAVKVKADDGLNVRSKGSTDGEIYGLAKNGSKLALLVEDKQDGWYQVSYQGKTAYVSAEYVDVVEVTLDEYNKLKSEAGASSKDSKDNKDSSASSKDGDEPASSGADNEDGE